MAFDAVKTQTEEGKTLLSLLSQLKRIKHPNSEASMEELVSIDTKVTDLANDITAKTGDVNEHKNLFIEIHHLLNELYIERDNKERAEKNLARAFKIDKTNIETIFRLGRFYQGKDDIEKSIKFFDRVNQLADLTLKVKSVDKYLQEGKYLETIFNLGVHHFDAERFLKAEAIFGKVIKLADLILNTPGTPLDESIQATRLESDSWFYQGKIKQEQKKNLETIKLFENAIEIDGNEKAYLALAETFFKLGKTEEATQYYESVIKSDPENVAAFKGIFAIYEEENKKIESFLELTKKTNDPEGCVAHFLKGEVYLKFAKMNNLSKFKDVEQTTVLYEVFDKVFELLIKAESSFSESFRKKGDKIDKDLEGNIKDKVQETRGFQKTLKTYKKEKTAAYGARLDKTFIDSFEIYFKWTEGQPVFAITAPYEQFARGDPKSSTPHYYLGKAYFREAIRLTGIDDPEEKESGDIFGMIDLASKSFNRAKKLEPEDGALLKPVKEAFSNLKEFQRENQ